MESSIERLQGILGSLRAGRASPGDIGNLVKRYMYGILSKSITPIIAVILDRHAGHPEGGCLWRKDVPEKHWLCVRAGSANAGGVGI